VGGASVDKMCVDSRPKVVHRFHHSRRHPCPPGCRNKKQNIFMGLGRFSRLFRPTTTTSF
jgi:hypothetical protein